MLNVADTETRRNSVAGDPARVISPSLIGASKHTAVIAPVVVTRNQYAPAVSARNQLLQ